MSKQTAVEFLAENLKDFPHIKHSQRFKDLVEEAKVMEQEQIERAWMNVEINLPTEPSARAFARKYYKQTYGGDK